MLEHNGRQFEVIESSRTTLSLILDRDGRFTIRCPVNTSEDELLSLIDRKYEWIQRKYLEWEDKQSKKVDVDDVSTIKYLGKRWTIHTTDEATEIGFSGGKICAPLGYFEMNLNERKKLISKFLTKRGKLKIPDYVKKTADGLTIQAPDVRILDLGFRWGSCSQNQIVNFHWKCLTLPSKVIRYIVSHEVAHLIVPDHSKKFWRVLEAVSPDYEQHEIWLKNRGINFDLY